MTKNYTRGDIFKNVNPDEKNISINADNTPHDAISENGVIGSILIEPEIIVNSENLKPKMFYDIELGTLYEIVHELFNKDCVTKIEDYTIISKVEENEVYKCNLKRFSTKELRRRLEQLRRVGTTDRNEYVRRCENVMNMDFRRNGAIKLRELSNYLEMNLHDEMNIANIKVQDAVMKISEEYLIDSGVLLIGDVIDEAWEEIESRRDGATSVGFPSKFPTINNYFTYEKGELIILGGRARRIWLAI